MSDQNEKTELPAGAWQVPIEHHETAHQIVQATIGLIGEVGSSIKPQGRGIALAMGAMLQGLLIVMIAAGKPGTTGDSAITMLTEQLKLNKEKAEVAAAAVQRDVLGRSGETLQ